jgi:hypothetical protein
MNTECIFLGSLEQKLGIYVVKTKKRVECVNMFVSDEPTLYLRFFFSSTLFEPVWNKKIKISAICQMAR